MRHTRLSAAALALATLFVLVSAQSACGEGEPSTGTVVLADLQEDLNLGFEASDQPEGWVAGGDGYSAVIDTEEKHSGTRSLRITSLESRRFGTASSHFPVEVARGKRLRLVGFVKTHGVVRNYAGLWMRVDGPDGVLTFDNMHDRGVKGTTDWSRCEIELDVAEEATAVVFGALLVGDGTAWVDSLSFELTDQPPPPPEIALRGVVSGPDGLAVEGAAVALISSTAYQSSYFARSGEDGGFTIELPAGEYAATATARGLMAAYLPPAAYGPEDPTEHLTLTLGEALFAIRGTVTNELGEPLASIPIGIYRMGNEVGDIFFTETDDQGQYELAPIPGEEFAVTIWDEELADTPHHTPGGVDTTVDIQIVRPRPAPDEAVAWIRNHAIPLKTAEAENGFADMQPLKRLIGDARVVALGEATHGTREFFQLKHRFLEFLVEEMGFTVFAIEANWPECLAINDYVLHGEGDAGEALDGIYFWTWNTEEVLEQIEWMRRYNAEPAREHKVKFLGFDMQTTTVAAVDVRAYLDEMEPEMAKIEKKWLETFEAERPQQAIQSKSESDREDLARAIENLLLEFDRRKDTWIERSSHRRWATVRQEVVLLRQALEQYSGGDSIARDRAMADNLEWILETEPPGTRVVAWAHNGHVSRHVSEYMTPMGWHLDRSLGEHYVALGFVFNRGSFQAVDWSKGRGRGGGVVKHTVGPAPAENIGAAFARTGLPIFVLDLRTVPDEGPVGEWLGVPRPMRSIGAVFRNEKSMTYPFVLEDHFDAVIFVDKTTRARPVERREQAEESTG